VVGSPRSGTTLLYHMLLSAGGFANYRAETHVFNTLALRFGDLRKPRNRREMTECFIRSDMFRISGVEEGAFHHAIESRCRSAGDFLRVFMEAVCQNQGVPRWAETTPVHALHIREIKATIPEALFIHVVRDGRDVAVSMMKQGWVRPFPMHRGAPELAAGAFWIWVVDEGHRQGEHYAKDYLRVSYEHLIADPQPVLDRIGEFIEHRLVFEEIQRTAIGSVGSPNTSFPGRTGGFSGRWRSELPARRAHLLEALLEPMLRRHGYPVESTIAGLERVRAWAIRSEYRASFSIRQAAKRTPLARRMVSLSLFQPGAVTGQEPA
jgi:LPS sulfotransferase NodH